MQSPLVSILCPAYKAAAYVGRMIDSILEQTYSHWELIIVEDGAEDNLPDVVASYGDSRISLIRSPHVGTPRAANLARSVAKGEIIARQDADDWSHPQRIEKQVLALQEEQADLVTCLLLLAKEASRGRFEFSPHQGGSGCDPYDICTGDRETEKKKAGPAWATIMAWRRVWEIVGPCNPTTISDDADWIFRALLVEPSFKWAHVDEPLYVYRIHHSQHSIEHRQTVMEEFLKAKRHYAPLILDRLRREGQIQ